MRTQTVPRIRLSRTSRAGSCNPSCPHRQTIQKNPDNQSYLNPQLTSCGFGNRSPEKVLVRASFVSCEHATGLEKVEEVDVSPTVRKTPLEHQEVPFTSKVLAHTPRRRGVHLEGQLSGPRLAPPRAIPRRAAAQAPSPWTA